MPNVNKSTRLGWTLAIAGLLTISSAGFLLSVDAAVTNPSYPAAPSITPATSPTAPPSSLQIPALDIDLPVTVGTVQAGNNWDVSRTGLSYLDRSTPPGTAGNTVIYGHNWYGLLQPLPNIQPDQEIVITSADNATYVYQVTDMFETTPADVSVLAPSDQDILTLYTCSGLLNQHRLIVRAHRR